MTKRLILMRHGHAGRAPTDHERPLTPRGSDASLSVARQLIAEGVRPDAVRVSDALRARGTAEVVAEAFAPGASVQTTAGLYHAGVGDLLGVILMASEGLRTLMIIGHNPGLEDLVGFLAGAHLRLAEAHLVVLTHQAARWEDVASPGTWTLEGVITPSDAA